MNPFPWLRPTGLAVLAAVLATPSCADKPATAITVAITSEASVPTEIDAISLEIHRGTTLVFARSYQVDPVTRQARIPGSLTVSQEDEESKTIRVQLRAEQKGEQVLLRSATTSFVEEKNKLLRLVLRYSCVDFPKACDAGQTCLGGKCADEYIDPAKLPDTPDDSGKIFPTVSQGGCFDISDKKCAADRISIDDLSAFAAAGCVFDTKSSTAFKQENLNVFAFWNNQKDQGHPVVVDHDPAEGWEYAAGSTSSFQLAPGLCDQVKSGKIEKVSFNFACATKPLSTPICQPDKEPTTTPTFDQSACHKCAYTPPECEAETTAALAEAASKPLFEAAFACPYDGEYNNKDECAGVRSCFISALAPILGCTSPDCETKYPKAKAWESCVANLADPSQRCAACATEGLNICLTP